MLAVWLWLHPMTFRFLLCEMGTITDFLRFKEEGYNKYSVQCLAHGRCVKGTLHVLRGEWMWQSVVSGRPEPGEVQSARSLTPAACLLLGYVCTPLTVTKSPPFSSRRSKYPKSLSVVILFPEVLISMNHRFLLPYAVLSGPEFSWKIPLRLQG